MAQAVSSHINTVAAPRVRMVVVVWVLTAVFYFYQYALRSAAAVMIPQLADAFGLTSMGVASMVGLFYYGYSPFSLVAGAAMDRLGPSLVSPLAHYQTAFMPLLVGVVIAIILAVILKETGPAVRKAKA